MPKNAKPFCFVPDSYLIGVCVGTSDWGWIKILHLLFDSWICLSKNALVFYILRAKSCTIHIGFFYILTNHTMFIRINACVWYHFNGSTRCDNCCAHCFEKYGAWMTAIQHYTWWRHQMETFSASLAICAGIRRSPVNSPHRGQWRGAVMFSLICVWINGWVNNREAGY